MNQRDSANDKSWTELAESPASVPATHQAYVLSGIIRAAATANLQIDGDLDADVAQLVGNAVDGLLEAAEILSRQLASDLDLGAGSAKK